MIFPFLRWIPLLTSDDIKSDLIAGLTGAVVVLPQGVAFAVIAGMPPEYGLYAGMIPAIIAALWGSSWHLVSGPTTAASIVIFASISPFAEPTTSEYVLLVLTLTFMVGILELVLGLAKLGELVSFISHSVIVGFTAGVAVLIAAKQLKNFFGVSMPRGGHLNDIIYNFFLQIPNINYFSVTVGLVTLLSGILIKRFWPRLPYLILCMIFGALAGLLLNGYFGQEITGIKTIGALPDTFPPFSSPEFSFELFSKLAISAVVITLFALTEAVAIARSLAMRSGQNININQEFIAQGLSNIAGSFFSGYVATGSFNRSGLNKEAGAKTPLAAALAGFLLIGIVMAVAPLASYIPNAAMAGILFLVAYGLIDQKEIKHILRSSRRESIILGITFFSALFINLEVAIFGGVIFSLLFYLERVAHPIISIRRVDANLPGRKFSSAEDLPECPQLKFVRIDGSLFFGSISYIQNFLDQIRQEYPEQKHLAIVAYGIHFADISGAKILVVEAEKRMKAGGRLYLIGVKQELWDSLDDGGELDKIGVKNFFQTKGAAIHGIFQKLDSERCQNCTIHTFQECSESKLIKKSSHLFNKSEARKDEATTV